MASQRRSRRVRIKRDRDVENGVWASTAAQTEEAKRRILHDSVKSPRFGRAAYSPIEFARAFRPILNSLKAKLKKVPNTDKEDVNVTISHQLHRLAIMHYANAFMMAVMPKVPR